MTSFFTKRFRDKQVITFDGLVQGSMGVVEYEEKFIELSSTREVVIV